VPGAAIRLAAVAVRRRGDSQGLRGFVCGVLLSEGAGGGEDKREDQRCNKAICHAVPFFNRHAAALR
jgi:hypothetical protein